MNTVYITKSVINEIYKTMINGSCENGGILGMDKTGTITHYCFDYLVDKSEKNEYRPSVKWLNLVIQQWFQKGINFCGIIHSHPHGHPDLSLADKLYAKRIMECNSGLDKIYFPVLSGDSLSELVVWEIEKNSNLTIKNNYIVLNNTGSRNLEPIGKARRSDEL